MDSGTAVDLLLVIGFILMGGVFAATELALVSLRSGQVDRLEEEGGRGAAVASLARDPNRFLSAVQIGVTVAGFFSAAFGASTLAPSFAPTFERLGAPAPETVSLVVTTLVVSYLSLVLGELVPKRLALQRSVGVARIFAPPLGRFATVMKPVIWLLSISTNLLVRLLGGNPDAAGDEVDEAELRLMIAGHEEIPADERKIVDDVFEAGDRMVVEVMTPRTDVAFLDDDLTLAEAVETISSLPYTRYPVTGRDFDEILGYVHLRDLLGHAEDHERRVRDIVRDLVVLPGTNRVLASLNALRHQGAHLALVIDEYGGTDGIVTLEDLVEELVGEIHDEYDQDQPEEHQPGDPVGVEAGMNIEEFAEETGIVLEDGPYETVAGYVLHRLGRVAEGGERVRVGDHVLVVREVEGHRITRVQVDRAEGASSEPSSGSSDGPDDGTTPQQATFADYFRTWGLVLPDEAVAERRDGQLRGAGWLVRFRWRDDGTLVFRADHRMTNERVHAIAVGGELSDAEPAAPGELMAVPDDASEAEVARIKDAYAAAWRAHGEAVSAAGLDFDRPAAPDDAAGGSDQQLWWFDDGAWGTAPLRPASSPAR